MNELLMIFDDSNDSDDMCDFGNLNDFETMIILKSMHLQDKHLLSACACWNVRVD